MSRRHKTVAKVVAGVLGVGALVGLGYATDGAGRPPAIQRMGPPANAAVWDGSALAALDQLWVGEKNQAVPYNRAEGFGEPWQDVDQNGCNTRDDILKRDLTGDEYRDANQCVVTHGWLADPYTGRNIEFTRGQSTSSKVQIDHVVSLSDAWRSGAWQLPYGQRVAIANDPLNLIATDGPTNASKGDKDASQWLPPNAAERCDYVSRQVAVKLKYALSVTPGEQRAMKSVLLTCKLQPLPGE